MKRIIFALATVATLAATPAFAGLQDEVAQETDTAVQVVAAPRGEKPWLGQYQILGSRLAQGDLPEGVASMDTVRIAPYPQAEQPAEGGS
jgi:hypothetical protein